MVTAWNKRERRESGRFAALMALTANCNRGPDQPAFTAADFLPAEGKGKPRRKNKRKAIVAFFDALAAQGSVKKEIIP